MRGRAEGLVPGGRDSKGEDLVYSLLKLLVLESLKGGGQGPIRWSDGESGGERGRGGRRQGGFGGGEEAMTKHCQSG